MASSATTSGMPSPRTEREEAASAFDVERAKEITSRDEAERNKKILMTEMAERMMKVIKMAQIYAYFIIQ